MACQDFVSANMFGCYMCMLGFCVVHVCALWPVNTYTITLGHRIIQ